MIKTFIKSILSLLFILLLASCQSKIDLIEHGNSNYKIVIPSSASEVEQKAAEEMQKYLAAASNVNVAIINDEQDRSENEISIGRTNRIDEIDIDVSLLEEDGFTIKTSNQNMLSAALCLLKNGV